MQSINLIIIYYWDKKLKRLHVLEADIITIINIDLMSPAQRKYLLEDMFQMTFIEFVSEINPYHFDRLYPFLESLYIRGIFAIDYIVII